MQAAPANIVEKTFWENEYYWADIELPCRADMTLPFDRSLGAALAGKAGALAHETVLEVGCAPAKWLIFYAERFNAEVSGIEYSEKGASLSRRNLASAGIEGEVREADFFAVAPSPYDIVLSIGFIEHFDDPVEVLKRQLRFVRPGGRLVVGVPNFRGLNGMLQRLAEPRYMALHNSAAMRPALYREFARSHRLEVLHLGYSGGFDPAIFRLNSGSRLSPRRLIPGVVTWLERRFRARPVADRLEHPLLSSYLLAVLRVPDETAH